jgi:hypothetical protein
VITAENSSKTAIPPVPDWARQSVSQMLAENQEEGSYMSVMNIAAFTPGLMSLSAVPLWMWALLAILLLLLIIKRSTRKAKEGGPKQNLR